MNTVLLKSKKTAAILYFFLALMPMSFVYSDVDMGKIVDQVSYIVIMLIFVALLVKNKEVITINDMIIISIFIIPIELVLMAEFSMTNNEQLLKKSFFWFCKILVYFFIGRMIGFTKYTAILRMGVIASLLFVILALFFGQFKTEIIEKHNELFLYFQNIGMLVTAGNDIGISLPITGDVTTPRIGGLFGHPNSWGIFTAFGYCGLFYRKTTKKQYAFWTIILLIVFAMTQSRAMLLFILVFVLVYVYTKKYTSQKYLFFIFKLVIPIIVVLSFYGLLFMRDTYTDANSVSAGRVDFLETAWNDYMSMDVFHQLFGIGMGTRTEYLFEHHGVPMVLDNSYVPLFLELGFAGAICWIGALIFALYLWIRQNKCKDIGRWLPLCVAVFVHSIVESTLLPGVKYGIPFYIFLFSSMKYIKQSN